MTPTLPDPDHHAPPSASPPPPRLNTRLLDRVLRGVLRELLPFLPGTVLHLTLRPRGGLGVAIDLGGYLLYALLHGRGWLHGWLRSLAGLLYPALYLLFAAAHLLAGTEVSSRDPLASLPREAWLLLVALGSWVMYWMVVRRGPVAGPPAGLFGRGARWISRGLLLACLLDCLVLVALYGVAAGAPLLVRQERWIFAAASLLFLLFSWLAPLTSRLLDSQAQPAFNGAVTPGEPDPAHGNRSSAEEPEP